MSRTATVVTAPAGAGRPIFCELVLAPPANSSVAPPPSGAALSWLLRQGTVTAPIVGASKPHHIEDEVAAVELTLTDKESGELEQPYTPHAVSGH